MPWDGLEYLKVPQWRTAFGTADVIFGVDVTTGREILVFGRGAMQMIAVTGMSDRLRALRVTIDCAGDELDFADRGLRSLLGTPRPPKTGSSNPPIGADFRRRRWPGFVPAGAL